MQYKDEKQYLLKLWWYTALLGEVPDRKQISGIPPLPSDKREMSQMGKFSFNFDSLNMQSEAKKYFCLKVFVYKVFRGPERYQMGDRWMVSYTCIG